MHRLNQWVSDLVSSKGGPRAVLLVGGPGNGKTDAVEGCIEAFDAALGAGGELLERFASEYRVTAEQIPPRKVTIDVTSFPNSAGLGDIATISLVQDATENDPVRHASAEDLLLDDLSDILEPDRPGIFLCCVNRGILASVASLAAASGEHAETESLVSSITAAATSGPNQPPCWPL
ncbi:MAG TPA: hypothetical protein EYO33_32390, partial [Phycisphaerales bacterium]|nr:hypothetical protein [Phycisphaerales bacterium]